MSLRAPRANPLTGNPNRELGNLRQPTEVREPTRHIGCPNAIVLLVSTIQQIEYVNMAGRHAMLGATTGRRKEKGADIDRNHIPTRWEYERWSRRHIYTSYPWLEITSYNSMAVSCRNE